MILFALLAVPLTAGAVSYFSRKRNVMEAANVTSAALLLLLSAGLAAQVLRYGSVTGLGGFLFADSLSALVAALTSLVVLVSTIYSVGYLRHEQNSAAFENAETRIRRYYALTPVFVASMMLVVLANNLGVMWVAIEATTLASVFLVTFYGKVTSLEAGWKYMVIGGVGLSMALFGTVVTFYAARGALETHTLAGLSWTALANGAAGFDKAAMRLAFILILLGYGTKAGIAPMHTWKPDAYSEAPVPTAAMLSTAMLNCALYGLIRHYTLAHRCLGDGFTSQLLILFGVLSMGIAVPFVLIQRGLRRLLAYSSIEHAGIMVVALGLGGALGSLGLVLHMAYHTVAKSLLFLCAGNVYQHYKTDHFQGIKEGIIHSMPLTGPVLLMSTLAIVGAPPFSLFQSEFIIMQAGFWSGRILASVLFILFATAIFAGAMVHVGKLVLGPAGPGIRRSSNAWQDAPVLALGLILATIAFWTPSPVLDLIRGAARVVGGQ
ncbi:MAG TPA: proton-conducting transporter membrane subunit [Bryobacteraceae bacterium]|nr:proton-conducting transporter membrane subunit [Bryobacteraceae bacterium]